MKHVPSCQTYWKRRKLTREHTRYTASGVYKEDDEIAVTMLWQAVILKKKCMDPPEIGEYKRTVTCKVEI